MTVVVLVLVSLFVPVVLGTTMFAVLLCLASGKATDPDATYIVRR